MSLEQLIINFSYVAIFLLMISNGVISFPSSQLLYVVAGFFSFENKLNFALVVLLGAAGNTVGNIILYEISRKKGMKYIMRLIKFLELGFINRKEIEKVQKVMEKKGLWFLFVGKLVSPIKSIIPIPAGMSKMNRLSYSIIIFLGSLVWAVIFTAIGYLFGKTFEAGFYYFALMMVLALIFMLIFYKYMNSSVITGD